MVKYFWLPLFALVIIAGCAKDIIVEPPPALRGVYTAWYFVEEDIGSGAGSKTTKVEAGWTFTDYTFWYEIDDESASTDEDHQMCNLEGDYKLDGSNVVFSKVQQRGTDICNLSKTLIEGSYNYIRDNDTIKLIQNQGTTERRMKIFIKGN